MLRQLFQTNLLEQVSGAKLRNPSTLQGSKHPGAIAPRRLYVNKSLELSKGSHQILVDLSILGHLLQRAMHQKIIGTRLRNPSNSCGSKDLGASRHAEAAAPDELA